MDPWIENSQDTLVRPSKRSARSLRNSRASVVKPCVSLRFDPLRFTLCLKASVMNWLNAHGKRGRYVFNLQGRYYGIVAKRGNYYGIFIYPHGCIVGYQDECDTGLSC
jgi:hypothetical protein